MFPSATENPTGLHRRYNVTKADGTPTDPNALYFVLRIDNKGDDAGHIRACRAALRAYAQWLPLQPEPGCAGEDLSDSVEDFLDELEKSQPLPGRFAALCPSCQGTAGHHEPECPDDERVRR
jgi:hypothetical protein